MLWVNVGWSWWLHQMETFSVLLAICVGNSPVTGEFPAQKTVTQSFDVFFDLRLNKRLSKQWWGWWFETLSCPSWRHCNDIRACFAKAPSHCMNESWFIVSTTLKNTTLCIFCGSTWRCYWSWKRIWNWYFQTESKMLTSKMNFRELLF